MPVSSLFGEEPQPVASVAEPEPPTVAVWEKRELIETIAVLLTWCGQTLVLAVLRPASFTSPDDVLYTFARIPGDIGIGLLVLYLLFRDGGRPWPIPSQWSGWISEGLWGMLLFIVIYVVDHVLIRVGQGMGLEPTPLHWDSALALPGMMAAFIITIPTVCLAEELLFRMYFQTRLTSLFGNRPVPAVLVSAGLFAAIHLYGAIDTLAVFGTGLVLGIAYQATRRVPRLVLAHMLTNLFYVRNWYLLPW